MAAIGQEMVASGNIPHLHSLIPGGRGQALAIWRPGHPPHAIGMTMNDVYDLPAGSITYLYCSIGTSRCKVFPIGRPGHSKYTRSSSIDQKCRPQRARNDATKMKRGRDSPRASRSAGGQQQDEPADGKDISIAASARGLHDHSPFGKNDALQYLSSSVYTFFLSNVYVFKRWGCTL